MAFIIQLISSAIISTFLAIAILLFLQSVVPALKNLLDVSQFILSFTVVQLGAIVGATLSFGFWRRSNPFAMKLLR